MSRPPAERFEDLIVSQKSHELVLLVYKETASFPKFELYALASQMRKAAISVPANIADGFKRRGKIDKARFMNVAQGSLEELRYYFVLARDLGYVTTEVERERIGDIGRLLTAYARSIVQSAS